MRVTTFSIAATLLIAASLAIFWPGRNAAPGVAAAVAQAPKVIDGRDPFAPPPAAEIDGAKKAMPTSRKSAAMVIEEKLNQPTKLDVVEMPFKDVVPFLQEQHQLPIVLKTKKLEWASVSPDTPITMTLNGVRLSTALDIILEDLGLTYYVSEVLVITTPEDAQTRTEVRIYDCRDILAMPGPGMEKAEPAAGAAAPGGGIAGGFGGGRGIVGEPEHRAQQLMTIITTNVDPQTWQGAAMAQDASVPSMPASGTVSEYNGLIVVTQTAHTHKKVEHVLDMLREAAGLEVPKAGKVVR